MILSDRDIKARLEKGDLVIKPIDEIGSVLGPSSIDVCLGNKIRVFNHTEHALIDPKNHRDEKTHEHEIGKKKIERHVYSDLITSDESFILHPGEFILASLKEYVEIPSDLAANIDGRSSLGRIGVIVHSTAGWVDPGYKGHLALEMTNIGKLPVKLYPGMRIGRLVFHKLSSEAEVPYDKKKGAKYVGDTGTESSAIQKDAEFD